MILKTQRQYFTVQQWRVRYYNEMESVYCAVWADSIEIVYSHLQRGRSLAYVNSRRTLDTENLVRFQEVPTKLFGGKNLAL